MMVLNKETAAAVVIAALTDLTVSYESENHPSTAKLIPSHPFLSNGRSASCNLGLLGLCQVKSSSFLRLFLFSLLF